ncbi:MAG TPA: hypothetical protein VN540_04705, partial [Clostridia bacterium]|nr:hypothetical protein [Clostridia bacterium]
MKRAYMMIATLALSALLFAGCAAGQGDEAGNTSVPDGVSSATTDDSGNATPAPSLTLDADAVSFTDRDSDASFDAGAATSVAFSGAQAEISGPGAALRDGILTISAEGTYIL